MPFPPPPGVTGGSDLGTFVNAVSGFMGGAAMMLQECRDVMADRGGGPRRGRGRKYGDYDDQFDEYDEDSDDGFDDGKQAVASEFDAVFAARDRALRQYNGGSGVGAEALQAWAEQPPPNRNALLQRLSEKLDDLESHEATVAARLRARRSLAARQAELDMDAHALGTNERTASEGTAILPLGAVVHALADGSDLPAVAGSESSNAVTAEAATAASALQALEGASTTLGADSNARGFGRAVQPIDVSMDATKANELAAHAEQFKLYRKHTCEVSSSSIWRFCWALNYKRIEQLTSLLSSGRFLCPIGILRRSCWPQA
jgi:hypothetical protein